MEEGVYYIRAGSERADGRARVLKHGDTFAVFDSYGDVQHRGLGEQGLYHDGTRFLSRFELLLSGRRMLLLGSAVTDDNTLLTVDLTNPDLPFEGEVLVPRGTLHVSRTLFLWEGSCFERLRVSNHGLEAVSCAFALRLEADFADVFEVRGTGRARRGRRQEALAADGLVVSYVGLDDVRRVTRAASRPAPDEVVPGELRWQLRLPPQQATEIELTVACRDGAAVPPFARAREAAQQRAGRLAVDGGRLSTSNEHFDAWLARSSADVAMMVTRTAWGDYPYAGVPWFSTVFGRDGVITALMALWLDPGLARGVLALLAATQAEGGSAESDAEPGKVLHEMRGGEMAALGEVPFGRYYGAVDTTPLFVMLAGAHLQRTADRAFAASLWPHVERALAWIDAREAEGQGFVAYARRSRTGLANQGWKDSTDSVFHADGSLAEPPIALCEVQAYAYAARRAGARLAEALGQGARARALRAAADAQRKRVEQAFWDRRLGTYCLALDGRLRPCRVRTSNAGHLLLCGLPAARRAARVADDLLSPRFHSGWGIRTVAADERRYNPMSYHNGSVWPHDNALIALGLSRYGLRRHALTVLDGLFATSRFVELQRLPELFCGFERRAGEGPIAYPMACAPQSWAAATVFMLLQACLGLSVNAARREVALVRPALPESVPELHVSDLRVGDARLDLHVVRENGQVSVLVPRRDGDVAVVVTK